MSQIKILFARLKINAERFRGFSTTRESPAGTRLAAAAEAAPTACTFRALGEPGGRRAIGTAGGIAELARGGGQPACGNAQCRECDFASLAD